MLVDASQFPGPALWQGLMLIVVSVWMFWVFRKIRTEKEMLISLAIIATIGIVLMLVITLL